MAKEPKPLREGYSAAYRRKLEQEFMGPVELERLGKAPSWVRETVSKMLKALENCHAEANEKSVTLKRIVDNVRVCVDGEVRIKPIPQPAADATRPVALAALLKAIDAKQPHREGKS